MKHEISCGAVIFTRTREEIRYLLVQQKDGLWGFPKGYMEPGETETETALREIIEEVHLRPVLFRGFRREEAYMLPGTEVSKTVVYFLGEYGEQRVCIQKEELRAARLFSLKEALGKLRFEGKQRILREADAFLKR